MPQGRGPSSGRRRCSSPATRYSSPSCAAITTQATPPPHTLLPAAKPHFGIQSKRTPFCTCLSLGATICFPFGRHVVLLGRSSLDVKKRNSFYNLPGQIVEVPIASCHFHSSTENIKKRIFLKLNQLLSQCCFHKKKMHLFAHFCCGSLVESAGTAESQGFQQDSCFSRTEASRSCLFHQGTRWSSPVAHTTDRRRTYFENEPKLSAAAFSPSIFA